MFQSPAVACRQESAAIAAGLIQRLDRVDDELAAPLVETGSLVPYRASVAEALYGVGEQFDEVADAIAKSAEAAPAEKPRSRSRKAAED